MKERKEHIGQLLILIMLTIVGVGIANVGVGIANNGANSQYEELGSMSGIVWHDINENNVQDNGEPGLPGFNISAVCNPGTGMECEYGATTYINGVYEIHGIPYGEYIVREDITPEQQAEGWIQTYPKKGSYHVTIPDVSGNIYIKDIDFGNNLIPVPANCHCTKIDVDIEKNKGKYKITGSVAKNGTDPEKTIDIELDINWVIKMLCEGNRGLCSAKITPTISSNLAFSNSGASQTSQTNTPAKIQCDGKCDTPVHGTYTTINANTKSVITVHKSGSGDVNGETIVGTITMTLNSDCPINKNTVTIGVSANIGGGKNPVNIRWVKIK